MHTLRCVANACTLIAHSFLVSPVSKSQDLHLPWYSLALFLVHVFCSLHFVSSVHKTFHLAMKRFSISPPIYKQHTHSVLVSKHENEYAVDVVFRCVWVPPLYYCTTTVSIRSSKWTQYIIIFFFPVPSLVWVRECAFVWNYEIHPQISVQTTL